MPLVTRVAKVHKLQPTMIIFCTILKLLLVIVVYSAFCYMISLCPNHVETNLKAASFEKLDVVSLVAAKWYIYVWIQMKLFICLYVLLMCMYVHFLEIKYQSINQSIQTDMAQSCNCHNICEATGANKSEDIELIVKIQIATQPPAYFKGNRLYVWHNSGELSTLLKNVVEDFCQHDENISSYTLAERAGGRTDEPELQISTIYISTFIQSSLVYNRMKRYMSHQQRRQNSS